jgi:hypothetical protein
LKRVKTPRRVQISKKVKTPRRKISKRIKTPRKVKISKRVKLPRAKSSKHLKSPWVTRRKSLKLKVPEGKSRIKRIRENGLLSSDDSSDCDAAVERFVRRTFPELLLGEDHPNQQYKKIVADEKARRQKLKENKLRTCSFCRKQETEVKSFKKCQK